MSTFQMLQAIRVFAAAATMLSSRVLAQNWVQTSAPITNWSGVASSADGSRMVAAVRGGLIYTSADSGQTWTPTAAPATNWLCVVSSADGSKVAAGGDRTSIYYSADYGAHWTAINPAGVSPQYSRWGCIASSADFSTLVALPINGDYGLYGSTNSGTDWVVRSTYGIIPEVWVSKWIALSADGARMAIVYGAGADVWINYLFADWPIATGGWFGYPGVTTSVACSADGSKLVVLHNGQCSNWDPCPSNCVSQFRYSWDFGATWPFECEGTVSNLTSVASSADGTNAFAVGNGPMIFATTNSGLTWDATPVPDGYWISVACSTDGAKAIAALRGGGVYVRQVQPAPVLKAQGVGDSVLLSWIVPSRPFRLEENRDLTSTNWSELAAAPTLDYTNLNLEVSVAAPQGRRFYRLALPTQ